jgi:hypothetical protein
MHGVLEYLVASLLVSLAVHAVVHRYLIGIVAAPPVCSVLNLFDEAWVADWQVNLAWGPPMLIIGWLLATPTAVLTGLPWLVLEVRKSQNGV